MRETFAALGRAATALLDGHPLRTDAVAGLVEEARTATAHVPRRRARDWERLLAGFARREPDPRRRERIEGLARACSTFAAPVARRPRFSGPLGFDAPIEALRGLGAAAARTLAERGLRDVGDLLLTVPTAIVDLRAPLSGDALVHKVAEGGRATVAVRGIIERTSVIPLRGRRAVRAVMRADGVVVELWWFFVSPAARALAGEVIAVGVPSIDPRRRDVLRMAHPRIVPPARLGRVEPIYPFAGVSSVRIATALGGALAEIAELELEMEKLDPIPASARGDRGGLAPILVAAHAPRTPEEHAIGCASLRERLAWAEACWLIGRRIEREQAIGRARAPRLPVDRAVRGALVDALGFTPTAAQLRAMEVLGAHLEKKTPTRTLLTGDVGTGKTAVLLAAAAQAVAARMQVAILAPTTLLADQYLASAGPLARATGARIALLPRTGGPRRGGRDNGESARGAHARVARAVADGEVDVVIGTHALLGSSVAFARLGLVIVDEQHRLGVAQRLALVAGANGGPAPHLITVSATPIPRTLALALRGEIATAHLDERPPGRRTPTTRVVPRARWPEVVDLVRACLAGKGRAFVVCARIAEAEEDATATPGAKARAEELARVFGDACVALVHGTLDDEKKRRAIGAFRRGDAPVLVGTSMLEVGVDVPEATLMVVDGADRFGLAQLHQLRGRVGRGARDGACVLVHGEPIGDLARARLVALTDATDGLEVAKADLRLRGPGDLEGARQSGDAVGLRWLDPLGDEALVASAARAMPELASHLADDPSLVGLRRVFARLDIAAAARDFGIARGEAG